MVPILSIESSASVENQYFQFFLNETKLRNEVSHFWSRSLVV